MKINNIKDLEKLLKNKEDLVNKAIKENEMKIFYFENKKEVIDELEKIADENKGE